ncbi:MAG: phytoene/squalene synthase family protein [Desulfobacterales bacterium]
MHDHYYEQQVLQKVSRSFALTIPQLPPDLRVTVTNAYLLCRIVDTIEDEEALSTEQKRFFMRAFNSVLKETSTAQEFAESLYPLLSGKTLPAEKDLIRNAGIVVRSFSSFNKEQQSALRRCVAVMSVGMLQFQENKNLLGLGNLYDLDAYCYHVAGVVGEMLTELFCLYSSKISKKRDQLLQLAVSFGQGLQMTNILKDLWDDRAHGACWLPRNVFSEAGFDLVDLRADNYRPEFGEGLYRLIGISLAHLRNALSYTLLIPRKETGIRKFCLWAIGLAIFTLRNINGKPDFTNGREVKVSRSRTRAVLGVSNATLQSNLLLKALFRLAVRGLPAPGRTHNGFRTAPIQDAEKRLFEYQSDGDV